MAISRIEVLSQLANLICAFKWSHPDKPHPLRVAIDGVDGAGKTVLADALAPLVEQRSRPVIRASIDGFHNPRAVRYQQGADSPLGYYQDSFNYETLIRDLLIPFGPNGDLKYRQSVFDLDADKPAPENWNKSSAEAILLFDGVFLLRPELTPYWDYSIFLDVDFRVSVPRAVLRDFLAGGRKGDVDARRAQYARRYVPGQRIYFREAKPMEQASIIVDNNDYQNPKIVPSNPPRSITS
jgi:uridine kinase